MTLLTFIFPILFIGIIIVHSSPSIEDPEELVFTNKPYQHERPIHRRLGPNDKDPEDYQDGEVIEHEKIGSPYDLHPDNYTWYESLSFDGEERPRRLIRMMRRLFKRSSPSIRAHRRQKRDLRYRTFRRKNDRKEEKTKWWVCGGRRRRDRRVEPDMDLYDYDNRAGIEASPMPEGRYGHGTAVIQNLVYAMGGHSPWKRWDPTVDVWDEANARWGSARAMHRSRSFFGVCTDGNTIYVCSGFGPGEDHCEVYDVREGWWYEFQSFGERRSFLAMQNRGGWLYAIGGKNRQNYILNTVDVYDPQRMYWVHGPRMNTARAGHGASILDDNIYVTGGIVNEYDPHGGVLSSCEVLEKPEYNQWRYIRPLRTPRAYHGIYRVWGAIVVFGGKSGRWGRQINSMESYDPKTDQWKSEEWRLGQRNVECEYYSMCATGASPSGAIKCKPLMFVIVIAIFVTINAYKCY